MNDDLLKSKKMKNIFNRKKWPYLGSWKFLGLLILSIVSAGFFFELFGYLGDVITTFFYVPSMVSIYFGYIAIIVLSALRANSVGHNPLILVTLGVIPMIWYVLGMMDINHAFHDKIGIPLIMLIFYIPYLIPKHPNEKKRKV